MNYCDFQHDWVELERSGIPLEPAEYRARRSCGKGLVIQQVGSIATNVIFPLNAYSVGYILELAIVSDVPGKAIITDVTLEVPWRTAWCEGLPGFEWLPGTDSVGNKLPMYAFPGETGLTYPREEVLNHQIGRKGGLRRGDLIEGLLLGVSYEPIPAKFRHGCEISVPLRICDQLGHSYSADFQLRVDRPVTATRTDSKKKPRRSLLSERDVCPVYSPVRAMPAPRRERPIHKTQATEAASTAVARLHSAR